MRTMPKIIILVVVAVAVLAGLGYAGLSASRQPEQQDFAALNSQRQAMDMSMNLYEPIVVDYTTVYTNALTEERSGEEADVIKHQYTDQLMRERTVNADRLERMASSVALKDSDVKKAFGPFAQRYQAVIDYYDQESTNLTNIIGSVAGPCAVMNRLNFAKNSIASDYTTAADVCLSALDQAKAGTDDTTRKLLGDVEALIKERRDKFKEVIGTEGAEKSARQLLAIVSILDINTELKTIQTEHQTASQKRYTTLVNQANESNKAFEAALTAAQKEEA